MRTSEQHSGDHFFSFAFDESEFPALTLTAFLAGEYTICCEQTNWKAMPILAWEVPRDLPPHLKNCTQFFWQSVAINLNFIWQNSSMKDRELNNSTLRIE